MPDADKKEPLDDAPAEGAADIEVTEDEVQSGPPPLDAEPDKEEPGELDAVSDKDEKTVQAEAEETTPFDDEKTDAVIDEIAAKESDEVLAAQDAAAASGAVKFEGKKRRNWFVRFWRNKWARSGVLFLLLVGAAGAMAMPSSRYAILNTAGVRSGSSVTDRKSVV